MATSSAVYPGIAALLSHPKFKHPSFFRKTTFIEPLNVDSVVENVTRLVDSQLGLKTKDIIVQRAPTSQLLLFDAQTWESLTKEKEEKKKNLNLNEAAKIEKSGTTNHKTKNHYKISHNVSNLTAKSLYQNNPNMFLFSGVPFATFLPPPLLPVPVERLSIWDGIVNNKFEVDEKIMTLEEYLKLLEQVRSDHDHGDDSSSEQSYNSSSSPKEIKLDKDLVGILSLTQNQLSFVIADSAKNVIQGPWTSMMVVDDHHNAAALPGEGDNLFAREGSSYSFQEKERREKSRLDFLANSQKFHRDFWTSVVKDVYSSSSHLDRCGCLWFRATNDVSHSFFHNCVSTSSPSSVPGEDNDSEKEENRSDEMKSLHFREKLRNDPRWLKLPSHIAKGKKACVDVDSMLRDMYIGFVKLH